MAGFNNIYVTTAGAELAVKTLEGKKLEFTVARLGDGILSDSSMDAIKARTGLENTIMEVAITGAKQTSETQATISFVLQNTEANSPFYFRELGIFALDPDTSDEVLFAYAYAGDEAEYINNSVSEIVEKEVNIVVTVDNASEVTITLDPSQIYVTEEDLEENLDEYVKQDDFEERTTIQRATVTLNSTVSANTNYTIPLSYQVGNNSLMVFYCDTKLKKDINYVEVGNDGEVSNTIQFLDSIGDLDMSDVEGFEDFEEILEFTVRGEFNAN